MERSSVWAMLYICLVILKTLIPSIDVSAYSLQSGGTVAQLTNNHMDITSKSNVINISCTR